MVVPRGRSYCTGRLTAPRGGLARRPEDAIYGEATRSRGSSVVVPRAVKLPAGSYLDRNQPGLVTSQRQASGAAVEAAGAGRRCTLHADEVRIGAAAGGAGGGASALAEDADLRVATVAVIVALAVGSVHAGSDTVLALGARAGRTEIADLAGHAGLAGIAAAAGASPCREDANRPFRAVVAVVATNRSARGRAGTGRGAGRRAAGRRRPTGTAAAVDHGFAATGQQTRQDHCRQNIRRACHDSLIAQGCPIGEGAWRLGGSRGPASATAPLHQGRSRNDHR